MEQSDVYEAYGYCTLSTAYKIVEPKGQCRSNWNTFKALAEGMGYDDEYFKRTEEEMLDIVLDNPTEALGKISDDDRKMLKNGGSISMPFAEHTKWRTKAER